MNKKFYLVTVLIEYSAESITDAHALHVDYEKAKGTMAVAIEEAAENFDGQEGETLVDVETCREWRNEDGYGYTVGIEELTLIE